jgi:GDP-4-dehydro-6-deoxy-D-mannose reductase
MNVLVTGANGFVGSWMIRGLLAAGHTVTGAVGREDTGQSLDDHEHQQVTWIPFNLRDPRSVGAVAAHARDAVIHLAGVASVSDSLRDPPGTWDVNCLGTVRLLEALAEARSDGGHDPKILVISTGEVYGAGKGYPRVETDPIEPCSPYAESKAAAEIAARGIGRRTGLRIVVVRPFPHTGPGQSARFVTPALASRVANAKRTGAKTIRAGNLDPVRDLLDVRDVVTAYLALLDQGQPGEAYNVSRGEGVALHDLLLHLSRVLEHPITPERDPSLVRPVDIPHLVGDSSKLRAATGWTPTYTLDQTLRDLIDAQAN